MKDGRPTKYKAEYAHQAYKACLLGATDNDLAELFNVNPDTITDWKKKHNPFSVSIKEAKLKQDEEVEKALLKRAIGYSHPETHFTSHEGTVIETPTIKHYPPDTAAASLWLRNRQPAKWRDKTDVEMEVKLGVEELALEIARKRKQMQDNATKSS